MANSDAADDLRLPQTVIGRLVKDALPPGVAISKEARTAIARAAAVFILHASTYAQECAVSNKRKTVNAVDVLNAVRVLECDELEKPIKDAVEIWRASRQMRNEEARKRKAERRQENIRANNEASVFAPEGLIEINNDLSMDDDMEQPESKRPLLTTEI